MSRMSVVEPPRIIVFEPPPSADRRNEPPRGIAGAQLLVAHRYGDSLTLIDLAKAAVMPTNTLTRQFNRAFGWSPMRWVWAFRTHLAREIILASPAWPLTEVALLCGFNSSAHFSRRFREFFHESPSMLRQRERRRHGTKGVRYVGQGESDTAPRPQPSTDLVIRALEQLAAFSRQDDQGT